MSDNRHLFNLVSVQGQKVNNSHYSTSFVLLHFWLRCLGSPESTNWDFDLLGQIEELVYFTVL